MATAADVLQSSDDRQVGHTDGRRPTDDDAHAQDPPLQPRGLRRAVVGRVHRADGADRPVAGRPPRGEVAPRRHARPPPLVRPRHLRVRRHADQRPERAGLQGPGAGRRAEGHGRADPRPAGPEGPDRRHGPVLRGLQERPAVPGQRRAASPTRSDGSRPRSARGSTTRPSASCARPAPRRARSSGATTSTSARRPS